MKTLKGKLLGSFKISSPEKPSNLPKITQPTGYKTNQIPSIENQRLTHNSILGQSLPIPITLEALPPSLAPFDLLSFLSWCPRGDLLLAEPPPSPQPDPHVMKGINTAQPPALPSCFPAAPARPLID